MADFTPHSAIDRADEIESIETQMGVLIRKLMRMDVYASERLERVIRAARLREVADVECGRVCRH